MHRSRVILLCVTMVFAATITACSDGGSTYGGYAAHSALATPTPTPRTLDLYGTQAAANLRANHAAQTAAAAHLTAEAADRRGHRPGAAQGRFARSPVAARKTASCLYHPRGRARKGAPLDRGRGGPVVRGSKPMNRARHQLQRPALRIPALPPPHPPPARRISRLRPRRGQAGRARGRAARVRPLGAAADLLLRQGAPGRGRALSRPR
jgi:hypothetical protein